MNDLAEIDKKLFFFLNELHTPWLDQPMALLSHKLFWLPLYLFLGYFIFRKYNRETWIMLLAIALTIVFADQITTTLMKPFFARLRPSRDPELQGLVHIVNGYRGGLYGFASSHAANTFGTATFVFLIFRNKKGISFIFLWAALVSYTRIYLGVHYPGDILVGAIVGALSAMFWYKVATHFIARRISGDDSSRLSRDSEAS